MKFYLITAAIFLIFTISGALIAFFKPMKNNILIFITMILSFFITCILQMLGLLGFFGDLALKAAERSELLSVMLEESPSIVGLAKGILSAFTTALVFPVVFFTLAIIFRIVLKAVDYFPKIMKFGYYSKENDGISEKDKTEHIALRFGSAGIGLISGFILSAMIITPVFYLASYAEPAVEFSRNDDNVNTVPVRDCVAEIDKYFYEPYENNFATKIYKLTGASTLICNIIDAGGDVTVNGIKHNAPETFRKLISCGSNIYAEVNAVNEKDGVMTERFKALAEDDLLVNAIADIVYYESVCLENGSGGIILDSEDDYSKTGVFEKYIIGLIADAFRNVEKEDVAEDVRIILNAAADLSQKEFFNDFQIDFRKNDDGNTAFSSVLVKNIRYIGTVMDSLYAADSSHSISDVLFEIIMLDEDVSQFLTKENIQQLNADVDAGNTNYTSFAVALQNLIGLVVN